MWPKGDASDDFPLRTYERITQKHDEWVVAGSDTKKLKEYENCRFPPLPLFPREGFVIDDIPPPSLHLKLGLVNHSYTGMVSAWPQGAGWATSLGIMKVEYHGALFEGGECDRLLDNVDALEALVQGDSSNQRVTRSSGEPTIHPALAFVKLFRSMKKMKDSSFGYALNDGWEEDIQSFKQCFDETGKFKEK